MIRCQYPAEERLTDLGLVILLAVFISITVILLVYLSGRSPQLCTDISRGSHGGEHADIRG